MYHSNDIDTHLSALVSGSSTLACRRRLQTSYITQILDKGNPPSFFTSTYVTSQRHTSLQNTLPGPSPVVTQRKFPITPYTILKRAPGRVAALTSFHVPGSLINQTMLTYTLYTLCMVIKKSLYSKSNQFHSASCQNEKKQPQTFHITFINIFPSLWIILQAYECNKYRFFVIDF